LPKSIRQPLKESYEQRLNALRGEREAIMKEIELREMSGASSPIYKKARTFLTHFWAKSDWQGRSELIAGARWLVGIGAVQSALPKTAEAKVRRRTLKKSGTHARYGGEQRRSRPVRVL
jgi:hypothetical protein